MITPVVFAMVPQSYRHRMQLHSGTDTENLESMATFNISPDCVPKWLGGNFTEEQFREWLLEQRETEREDS